jgi:MFS family permease
MTAAPLSGVIGGPISGALLGLHLTGGLAGWQWMFLIEGIPAVLLGFVALAYLVDRPEEAGGFPAKNRMVAGETRAGRSGRVGDIQRFEDAAHMDAGAGVFRAEYGFVWCELVVAEVDQELVGS